MTHLSRPLLLILIVTVAAVYFPGLNGPFLLDDYFNILDNPSLAQRQFSWPALLAALDSGSSSIGTRPLAQLSFAFNLWLNGEDPFGFKLTNLVIHLANILLAHAVVYRLTNHRLIALTAAGLWGAHPLQLTSVLYTVQRMNSLAAMCILAGILGYLHWRLRKPVVARLWAVVATVLAISFKETGILLPFLIIAIEFFLLRPTSTVCWPKLAAIAAACVAALTISVTAGWWDPLYLYRTFSVTDRLLSQPLVLTHYLGWFFLPDIRSMGLFHDDWFNAHPIGLANIVAIIGLTTGALACIALKPREPIIALGLIWFLLGHAVESSPLPLEMVFEHRNYLPTLGLALATSVLLQRLSSQPLRAVLSGLMIVALCGLTLARSLVWGDISLHANSELTNHPYSERARLNAASVMLRNQDYTGAQLQLLAATQINPRSATGYLGLLTLAGYAHTPPPQAWFSEANHRMQNYPMDGNTASMAKALLQCQISGPCTFPHHAVLQLFRSAADNPKTHPALAANLATFTGIYALEKSRDFPLAEQYYRRAIDHAPKDPNRYLNIAYFFLATHRYAEGLAALESARRLDKLGSREGHIVYMQQLLNDRKQRPPTEFSR